MTERDSLRVLEAGCGSGSQFKFRPKAEIVGIDISQEQLDRNQLLHEKLVGDIQTFPLAATSFDAIVCWDVLEHLEHPELALHNFYRCLRPGGIMILGAPLAKSLKGAITRWTPHWFHVSVYRHWLGFKNAGKPGYVPFRTFLQRSMSPPSIKRFAREKRLLVEFYSTHQGPMQIMLRKNSRVIDFGLNILSSIAKGLSIGAVDPCVSDFIIVLRKT